MSQGRNVVVAAAMVIEWEAENLRAEAGRRREFVAGIVARKRRARDQR